MKRKNILIFSLVMCLFILAFSIVSMYQEDLKESGDFNHCDNIDSNKFFDIDENWESQEQEQFYKIIKQDLKQEC